MAESEQRSAATSLSTMASAVGKLEAFDPAADSIAVYSERVEIYFAANSVPEGKHVVMFLSLIRGNAYALLHHLLAPRSCPRCL